jgi:hypothetical protein
MCTPLPAGEISVRRKREGGGDASRKNDGVGVGSGTTPSQTEASGEAQRKPTLYTATQTETKDNPTVPIQDTDHDPTFYLDSIMVEHDEEFSLPPNSIPLSAYPAPSGLRHTLYFLVPVPLTDSDDFGYEPPAEGTE